MGKALSVPPAAVLGGLLIITSFIISPAVVTVPGTSWVEPALIWLTISMPTGSRKTTIYQFLRDIVTKIRRRCQCKGELMNIIYNIEFNSFASCSLWRMFNPLD